MPNGKRRAPLASPLPTRQGVPPLPVLDSFRRGPGAASEYGSHIPPVGSVFSPARGRDSQRLGFPSPLSDSPISHAQDSQDRGPWEKSRSAEGCEVQAWGCLPRGESRVSPAPLKVQVSCTASHLPPRCEVPRGSGGPPPPRPVLSSSVGVALYPWSVFLPLSRRPEDGLDCGSVPACATVSGRYSSSVQVLSDAPVTGAASPRLAYVLADLIRQRGRPA